MLKRDLERLLPLLSVLRSVSPEKRVILLSHFDDATRDAICRAVTFTLTTERLSKSTRKRLKQRLEPYREDFRYIIRPKGSPPGKRRRLLQVGAGPMNHVIRAAIPLLLNMFPK